MRGDSQQVVARDNFRFQSLNLGAGIAEADQQRIFERFQQAVSASPKRSGFGIGLWLIKSLVEAHGGSISLQSRVGEGSTFTVLLPGLV